MAGAEVQRVVRIDAVGGGREAALQRHRVEHGKEFIFAKETTVGGVRAIRRIFQLVRFDEFVMDLEIADEFVDRGAVVRRKAGRECGDRKSAVAKRTLRGPRQVSGIGASGERDDQRACVGKTREERNFLLLR